MGRKLFKQPNGLYGIYSTYVDGIVRCNMKKEDYIKMRVEDLKEELEKMFAEEETSVWKGTIHANILDSDILFETIGYYSWSEEDLNTNICLLRSAGYSKEKLDELENKWKDFRNCIKNASTNENKGE